MGGSKLGSSRGKITSLLSVPESRKNHAVDTGLRGLLFLFGTYIVAVAWLPNAALADVTGDAVAGNSPGWWSYAVVALISLVFSITPVVLRRRQHQIRQTRVRQVAIRYQVADLMDFLPQEREIRRARDYYLSYVTPSVVLTIVVALHASVGIVILNNSIQQYAPIFLASVGASNGDPVPYISLTLMAIVGAFLGSFVWASGYVYRRLASYDLTPATYFQVSLRMLSGTMVAIALRHILPMIFSTQDEFLVSLVILAAFVSGYEPSFGIRLVWQWANKFLRQGADNQPAAPAEKTSVQYIDGISTYIKTRLEEFEIDDVQNLATENPITLYARTPFGLPEIVDWIAQAQLYQLFSRDKIQALKRIGVRNIFHFHAQALGNSEFIKTKLSEDEQVPLTTSYVRLLARNVEAEPAYVFIERLSAAMKQRGRWRIP